MLGLGEAGQSACIRDKRCGHGLFCFPFTCCRKSNGHHTTIDADLPARDEIAPKKTINPFGERARSYETISCEVAGTALIRRYDTDQREYDACFATFQIQGLQNNVRVASRPSRQTGNAGEHLHRGEIDIGPRPGPGEHDAINLVTIGVGSR